jgi:hypothetical protein
VAEEKDLTKRQKETLLKVAELNGAEWKSLVDQAWKTGRYFELEGVTLKNCQHLFQLCDKQGTSWLASLDFDKLQVEAVEVKIKQYQKRVALRNLRKTAGLSIVEATKLSGTKARTWEAWEYLGDRGNNPPEEAFTWLKNYIKEQRLMDKKRNEELPTCPPDIDGKLYYRMCHNSRPIDFIEKYDFKTLENVPGYCLLPVPSELKFSHPKGMENCPVLELPLRVVLETRDEEDRFCLHPDRWHFIKKELSEGQCVYPWIGVNPGGRPYLEDGRHRIVYMLRIMGLEKAPFVMRPEHLAAVRKWVAGLS